MGLEALETRLLLSHDLLGSAPDPPVSPGSLAEQGAASQLSYSAPSGNGPDQLVLRYNSGAGELEILDGGTSSVLTSQALATTSDVLITGADDTDTTDETDTLTIDFAEAFSIGVEFRGGLGGADSLIIVGGTFTTVTYEAAGADSGSVDFDGMAVAYSGLEPVTEAAML